MINQYEVPAFIEDTIPELRRALHQFPAVFHIYETVTCFTDYTSCQLRDNNYSAVGKCLELAGKLYERGNSIVKGAITRIFLPALSAFPIKNRVTRITIYSLIPASLYNLYIQHQLNVGGPLNEYEWNRQI
ncbi:DUF7674 family protein [Chitinophaga defluvii]|uniref:DUF7674 domain-containing protein n=1 Tax=Chitinophaga defluvii TaxID=3163343 RepID=A0ABV2T917_9BACT